MTDREKLIELLAKYFTIGDSYAYNLTRVKEAFAVGTVSLDDFVEFDDETVADIADHLIANGVTVQEWIPVSDPPKKNGYYMCWKLFSAVGERKEYREEILFYEDNMWLENARSFRKEYPMYWMHLPQPPKGE